MPIATGDIKLLKAQVLLDTPDGGGYMTANEVVDGVSNNLFPDVSELSRVYGRVELRKAYVALDTSTTESYYGAHVILDRLPADPKTVVNIYTTKSWSDRRTQAKEAIERYTAKGPRLTCKLLETHYAGSLLLTLISLSGLDFPAAGDAVVLRAPNGVEQTVRLIKVAVRRQSYTVSEGSSVASFDAYIAVCNLGTELTVDFVGPPLARATPNESAYALLYTTNVAAGAKFYSAKPLTAAAAINDLSMQVSEVYNHVVPAATSESPLIDQYPLSTRRSLARIGLAALTLSPVVAALGPNSTLRTPTAIDPGSFTLNHGGTLFADDGLGSLKQGTTVVGTVAYLDRTATFAATAPTYGSANNTITYKPAGSSGAAAHSDSLEITAANQGLAFVYAFEPVPAPGTFGVSYMAQGRWYELLDNGTGRLLGADTSYGSGSISYSTGSVSMTLGALPDVGSYLIFTWGDSASTKLLDPAVVLPTRLVGTAVVDNQIWQQGSLTLTWARGATNYTATANPATGVITGDATGLVTVRSVTYWANNTVIEMRPAVFPDGDVTIAMSVSVLAPTTQVVALPGAATLGAAAIAAGTVTLALAVTAPVGRTYPGVIYVRDDRAGNLVGGGVTLGTVDYSTGAISVVASYSAQTYRYVTRSRAAIDGGVYYFEAQEASTDTITVNSANVSVEYAPAAGTVVTSNYTRTLVWGYQTPLPAGGEIVPDSLAFSCGGEVYSAAGGVLRKGWDALTDTPATPNAGTVGSGGSIAVTALPANGQNTLVWGALAQQTAGSGGVQQGVFRTVSAPIKTASMQLQAGASIGVCNSAGVISGGGFTGQIDFQRGIVRWAKTALLPAKDLAYNAVFLQYLPLSADILGLDTARLPLDGRVPIYRAGDVAVVHHTDSTDFPGTPIVGTVLNVGRVRVSYIKVRDNLGVALDTAMYGTDLDAGTVTLNSGYALGALQLPLKAEHRIEDVVLLTEVQISGLLKMNRPLTHAYPASGALVSSALVAGDLQARVFGKYSQSTWTEVWADVVIGSTPAAQYNDVAYPIVCTNRGALEQRWALVFTSGTGFRVLGDTVGQVATGDINSVCAPINPANGVPYFTLQPAGFGAGWSSGNVLRFNTAAANYPVWVARATLQGPAGASSDAFGLQARGDIDRV